MNRLRECTFFYGPNNNNNNSNKLKQNEKREKHEGANNNLVSIWPVLFILNGFHFRPWIVVNSNLIVSLSADSYSVPLSPFTVYSVYSLTLSICIVPLIELMKLFSMQIFMLFNVRKCHCQKVKAIFLRFSSVNWKITKRWRYKPRNDKGPTATIEKKNNNNNKNLLQNS